MLRKHRALEAGDVVSVELTSAQPRQGQVAEVLRLGLGYGPGARGRLPTSIIVKRARRDVHAELLKAGVHEVTFYRAMAKSADSAPIPLIYGAHAGGDGFTELVMEDLTDTHFQQPLPIPPSNQQCERIMLALAALHSRWWNSPQLGADLGARLTSEQAEATQRRLHSSFPAFADYLGDALLPRQKAVFERVLGSSFLDRLSARLIRQQDVTITHGDVHTGNVMLPRFPRGEARLIDWHLWGINLAMLDLAFLMALHWPPARRALLEKPLLRLYHQSLQANGVKSYSWDHLWHDYRTEVIVTMLIPIGQHRRGSPPGVIWQGLQDSWAAVEDLGCLELL